jgi:hypothetical protein
MRGAVIDQTMADRAPRPFKLLIGDELLDQSKKKLASARIPEDLNNGWEDGSPETPGLMVEIVRSE